MIESVRQGHEGLSQEISIIIRPWGFELEDVSVDIHLWYSSRDKTIIPETGVYISRRIQNSKLTIFNGGHHISTYIRCMGEAIRYLLS